MNKLDAAIAEILQRTSTEAILPHFQNLRTSDIRQKGPDDPVTIADHLSEEMLHDALAKLLPDAAIVGEEAAAKDPEVLNRLTENLTWIIDPIDGTANFAAGRPPFGIIIALSERNETIAGWIYDPLANRLCMAHRGQGAYINGQKITAPTIRPEIPVAALATGFLQPNIRDQLLSRTSDHYEIVDIPRCAAEQYPRLSMGVNHLSTFERTLPWDHAAGILFLNEAGGRAARWNGDPYRPADERTGLLGASSPWLWDEAAELLGDIFDD